MSTHDPLRTPRYPLAAPPAPGGGRDVVRDREFLEELREETLQRLGLHFASGDMAKDELQRRIALALQASSPDALDRLVYDQPPLDVDVQDDPTALLADSPVPERGVLVAVMGGNGRKGAWVVPRHLKVVAIMGGAELDLRRARFAPGVTEIEVLSIMGGVDILVPPGVRVEMLAFAAMGGVDANVGDVPARGADQPVVRISGLAALGGVQAHVKRPSTRKLRKFAALLAKARKAR